VQRVVLDTCVLFPDYLRDTLLRLAEAEIYEPLWSADILEELRRNVAAKMPEVKAKRLVEVMAESFPHSAVTGYATLVPDMRNDPKDRHVLAAAVCGEAHAIVTRNLRDFPAEASEPYDIEVLSPDDSVCACVRVCVCAKGASSVTPAPAAPRPRSRLVGGGRGWR
jgi:predicted nucleic acid-binding protein